MDDRKNSAVGSFDIKFYVLAPFLRFIVIRGWIPPHISYISEMHLIEILR